MVMVDEHIFGGYLATWKDMNEEKRRAVTDQIDGIRLWGERRGELITVPELGEEFAPRVYLVNKKPFERKTLMKVWPLEFANRAGIRVLDERVVDLFRALKGIGIKRPSILAPGVLLNRMYSRDIINGYDNNLKKWAGVNFVYQRLYGTSRIAARYDNFEKFGPVTKWKDGWIIFKMSKESLAPELRRRGLLSKRPRS